MRSRTRLAIAAATAAALATAVAAPAHAAPVNSPQISGPLFGYCSGVGEVEIVSPPASDQAQFTPGFIVGTHAVAVPYAFDFVLTANGNVIDEQFTSKQAVPKNAQVCSLEFGSFTDGDTTYTYSGRVLVAIHGKP